MTFVAPVTSLRGDIRVPGDKSISHRALLLGALADGVSELRGLGRSWESRRHHSGHGLQPRANHMQSPPSQDFSKPLRRGPSASLVASTGRSAALN